MTGRLPSAAKTWCAALAAAAVLACGHASAAQPERIVSIGGSVTEILFALGEQDRIVAVDSTSTYPAPASDKPDVGYMRALTAEGVLSVDPDLVLVQAGSGPPDALALIKAAVPVTEVQDDPSPAGIEAKIWEVGAAVGRATEAEALAADLRDRFAHLKAEVSAIGGGPRRVLFVLSLANGRVMAAGRETSADAMISLAGGINAVSDFTGFKPMVDEAVIAAAPDVIVVMARGEHAATPDEVFTLPAFQATPAAASRSLVTMDGLYLLGLGPRTPDAARDLAAALYPGRIRPATP
jgi:iron complex transport system substrate-binding protein